ncbi:hypothetical protein [Flavobacterium sp. XGLA_31]|uniref:hypothetical protein n=1 Tax=Flavobacterium sp. XGLA_31 TaxID=3447666 RepID=UPI003F315296
MRNFVWFVFTLVAFTTLSCQEEEESVVQDTTNNFSKSSPISSLIKRVSQYETSADNVIDGTSYCSMKLPISAMVNGQYVYVIDSNDFEDFQEARDLNGPSNDNDDVQFDFSNPITLIYPNYEEYSVSSQTQLDYILSHYGDDSAYHEIKCVDFIYTTPIKINLYNTDNQVASTVSITGNEQFYNFLDNLSTTQVVGIQYPIQMHKSGGGDITVHNNSELEDAIDEAVSACNSGSGTTSLANVFTSGTWKISSYFENNFDETYHYTGYNFTFNSGGTLMVVKNSIYTQGDWDVESGSSPQQFSLHFEYEDQYLHELEENWQVQEYTATYVRLKHEEGGGECYYLNFTKNN